jgi:hypothetical protein
VDSEHESACWGWDDTGGSSDPEVKP